MESEWSATSLDGRDDVVLVTVDLRNPSAVDRRVRVTNRLDGPVLAPRRAGVPEPGWDDDGFGGVVPADGRLSLGYACPSPMRRPPVSVVDEGRSDGEEEDRTAAAIRGLGDPRPPGDAIPKADDTDDPESESVDRRGTPIPPAVESWLTAVEERMERGEQLTAASVDETTTALDADDTETVPELKAQLDDDGQAAYEVRDAAMAENVAWLLDYEDEHRVAVWAHDDHVRRGEVEAPDWTAETMGEDLDSEFGTDYYALSLQFARGEFQVYDPDSDAPTRAVSIADPPAESLPNLFDTLGGDAAVLDLDAVDDGSPLEDWLAEPRRVHSIGATFDADDYPVDYVPAYDLRETFDGVAFVGDSTRARPVERGGE